MKYFSSNLEFLRKLNKLKQADIQASIGIERTNWSNYERGVSFPKLELFHKIAEYFKVSETDLLNTDLSNVHLNKNDSEKKKGENVHLNVHPSVHLKGQKQRNETETKKEILTGESPPKECEKCKMKDEIIKALKGQLKAYEMLISQSQQRIDEQPVPQKRAG